MFRSAGLNAVLTRELASGNWIAEDGPGWGNTTRLIILQQPFQSSMQELVPGLVVRDVNDPHYWKTEIEDTVTREMLACRFE